MEREILDILTSGEEIETDALVLKLEKEKKKEINPSLYRLASLGYIEKIQEKPPRWRRIPNSLPDRIFEILSEATEPMSTKELVTRLDVKKPVLNSCLYALEKRKELTVIKDEKGFDPRWNVAK